MNQFEQKKQRMEHLLEQMMASISIPTMFLPLIQTYLSSALDSLSSEEQIDAILYKAKELISYVENGEDYETETDCH